ncbi:hypothetical protein J31TS4_05750 [Paenibacillus sp. J31TS4]|uniref:A24 family peptidase n=1 Tax=Paenibacillus sp. J31TS4 TaxID=2807195 RepID=UPI001B28FF0A|nr:prepilin peptidase [Paenibacillus sp. J31TS4]GIP37295.1 hypothetical protein J31TS4_05750 [Paenibacillus sp. J31TS4]
MLELTMASGLIAASFITDLKNAKIYNRFTVAGTAGGLLVHSLPGGWEGFLFSFAGLAAGFVIMLLLYAFRAVGAGDVKLFAALGAIAGMPFVLTCMAYSLLFAFVIGIGFFLAKRVLLTKAKEAAFRFFDLLFLGNRRAFRFTGNDLTRFPFMLAVAPAFAVTLVEGGIWL